MSMAMNRNGLLLSQLSNELILICDEQMMVREANEIALATLSAHILGRPLLKLVVAMARTKGEAFITELQHLDDTNVSSRWELLLHIPHATPLLTSVRGGRLPDGGWMIIGSSDSPRLTQLYHEMLSLNIELTSLIRDLTREQAALTETINRMLERQNVESKKA